MVDTKSLDRPLSFPVLLSLNSRLLSAIPEAYVYFSPFLYHFLLRWNAIVVHFGLDQELVSLAYHYYDRFIDEQVDRRRRNFTIDQSRCIEISVLLLAIKVKLPREEVGIAGEIATAECTRYDLDPQELNRMEAELLTTLEWRVNAPTIHEFVKYFSLLHPLNELGDDFTSQAILDIARSQVGGALPFPEIMLTFKSSEIAFAALQRAGEQLISEEMIDALEVLMDELGIDDNCVLHATFALENLVPLVPQEEAPLAAAVARAGVLMQPYVAIQVDDNGDVSPRSVAANCC